MGNEDPVVSASAEALQNGDADRRRTRDDVSESGGWTSLRVRSWSWPATEPTSR